MIGEGDGDVLHQICRWQTSKPTEFLFRSLRAKKISQIAKMLFLAFEPACR